MNSFWEESAEGEPTAWPARGGVLSIRLPGGLLEPDNHPPGTWEDNARGVILGAVTRTGQGGIPDLGSCADAGVYLTMGPHAPCQIYPKPVNHVSSADRPLVIGLLGGTIIILAYIADFVVTPAALHFFTRSSAPLGDRGRRWPSSRCTTGSLHACTK